MSWEVVVFSGQKANSSSLIFPRMSILSLFVSVISNYLPRALISDIGLWLFSNFWSFPCFGIIITVTCFQFTGKYFNRRHVLKNSVIWSMVLSKRYFSTVLVIVLEPSALIRDNLLIINLISLGYIGRIFSPSVLFSISIVAVTSFSNLYRPFGQVNCDISMFTKISALPHSLYTSLCCHNIGWLNCFLFIKDLQVLKILRSFSFLLRKEFHFFSL